MSEVRSSSLSSDVATVCAVNGGGDITKGYLLALLSGRLRVLIIYRSQLVEANWNWGYPFLLLVISQTE